MKTPIILLIMSIALFSYGVLSAQVKSSTPTKTELVAKVRNRATTPLSYQDFTAWATEFNKENQRCGFQLKGVTSENIITKLNDALEGGC